MFNINEAIREQLAGSEKDPAKIAKAVAVQVPEEELRDHLALALRHAVVLLQNKDWKAEHPIMPLRIEALRPVVVPAKARWEEIVEGKLHATLGVGAIRKRWADLTVADLTKARDCQYNLVGQNRAAGDELDRHLKILQDAGVATYGQLSKDAVREAFEIPLDTVGWDVHRHGNGTGNQWHPAGPEPATCRP